MQFGSTEYWNAIWVNNGDDAPEWYLEADVLMDYLRAVERKERVLVLGCGVDAVGECLAEEANVRCVVLTDSSAQCIDRVRARVPARLAPKLEFHLGDLLLDDMWSAKLHSFDLVIDKGFIDAISCRDDESDVIPRLFAHVLRALSPGGVFVIVSAGLFRPFPTSLQGFASLRTSTLTRRGKLDEICAPHRTYDVFMYQK